MISRRSIYDNWVKLVGAVVKREHFLELCHDDSSITSGSSTTLSDDFQSLSAFLLQTAEEPSRNSHSSLLSVSDVQSNQDEKMAVKAVSSISVTELVEGCSSRKIVEIICRTNGVKSANNGGIERILKVHHMYKILAQFEEYRDLVKIKASKLPNKHPRCLADGNELLRFYGATVQCALGTKSSSSLCASDTCQVCRFLTNCFSTRNELSEGIVVFTASTSGRAFEQICSSDDERSTGKALVVCRVIAGRVHRPLENIQEMNGQSGFDSLAVAGGYHSNVEELYLLSPRALLPCFVVIYKP